MADCPQCREYAAMVEWCKTQWPDSHDLLEAYRSARDREIASRKHIRKLDESIADILKGQPANG